MSDVQAAERLGSFRVVPTEGIEAGTRITLTIEYTVGDAGLAVGGGLALRFPNTWEKPLAPQHDPVPWAPKPAGAESEVVPYSPRNLSATPRSAAGGASLLLTSEQHWARITVRGAALAKGDTIVIVYGDTSFGCDGALVSNCPRNDQGVELFADAAGNGEFAPVAGSPCLIGIVPGDTHAFLVVGPSLTEPGSPIQIKVAALDRCHNASRSPFISRVIGKPRADSPACGIRVVSRETATKKTVRKKKLDTLFTETFFEGESNSKVINSPAPLEAGVLRVAVTDETGEVFGMSNPIESAEPQADYRIFWGDLHGRSGFTLGACPVPGTARSGARKVSCDDVYTFARKHGLLDFAAVADENGAFRETWKESQEAAVRATENGKFVALKCFEWASPEFGHRGVYFRDAEIEAALSGSPRMPIDDFYALFKDRQVIIIPYHPFLLMNWSRLNPEFEPVTEIYSGLGASERHKNPLWTLAETPNGSVQAALARGYRLGFMACSHTNIGCPGRAQAELADWLPYKGGLTAVCAKELTREALFDALKARRCYATTGARIILKVSVNDQPMGSVIEIPKEKAGDPRALHISAVGTDVINKIEVVCNNDDAFVFEPLRDNANYTYDDDLPFDEVLAESKERGLELKEIFYYVRVTQRDGEMAWSSPIWVRLKE